MEFEVGIPRSGRSLHQPRKYVTVYPFIFERGHM